MGSIGGIANGLIAFMLIFMNTYNNFYLKQQLMNEIYWFQNEKPEKTKKTKSKKNEKKLTLIKKSEIKTKASCINTPNSIEMIPKKNSVECNSPLNKSEAQGPNKFMDEINQNNIIPNLMTETSKKM